ncbi:hypothetical protein ACIRL2_44990 [Embleya sp. NPDC127516]|uniref:hypothetical protein n=1 Tax=Embleya sp. NPDC127516 TaxID=3363990 RepID=UPI003822DDD2
MPTDTVFHVHTQAHGSACEVAVTGEPDLATAPQLRAALTHALAGHQQSAWTCPE